MPTLFELMPLLDGWDYHVYIIPATLITKTRQMILTIDKPGWVLGAGMGFTDAFASLLIRLRGPGGIEHEILSQPEALMQIGSVQADPTGYLQLYYRPIPASTAGNYFAAVVESGFFGEPLPYKPPIKIEGFLDSPSTQNAAFLAGSIVIAEIKDEKTFKDSLADYYATVVNKRQMDAMKDLTEAIKGLAAKLK